MSSTYFSSAFNPLQAFLFGGTGGGEVLVIFVVLLLLFGPRKLPEIARTIGKILSQLRRASYDFRDQIMNIGDEPEAPAESSLDVESDEVGDAGEEEPADDRRLQG